MPTCVPPVHVVSTCVRVSTSSLLNKMQHRLFWEREDTPWERIVCTSYEIHTPESVYPSNLFPTSWAPSSARFIIRLQKWDPLELHFKVTIWQLPYFVFLFNYNSWFPYISNAAYLRRKPPIVRPRALELWKPSTLLPYKWKVHQPPHSNIITQILTRSYKNTVIHYKRDWNQWSATSVF